MDTTIDANTGEVKVSGRGVMLRSTAIGSCIVVAAYDARNRVGGLAHIMLPGKAPCREREKTKYAADAIARMAGRMVRCGASRKRIECCLVGAANVLKRRDDTICRQNVESVREMLRERKIPIKAAITGGTQRKSITLDVENGSVFYARGGSRERLLHHFR